MHTLLLATAPGAVTPPETVYAGDQPYAAESWWNQAIGDQALWDVIPTALLNSFNAGMNRTNWTVGVCLAQAGDPVVDVLVDGEHHFVQMAPTTSHQARRMPGAAGDSDSPFVVMSADATQVTHFYQFVRDSNTTAHADIIRTNSTSHPITGLGFGIPGNPPTRSGTEAGGGSNFAGLITAQEWLDPSVDAIKHMLRWAMGEHQLQTGAVAADCWQWPCSVSADGCAPGCYTADPGLKNGAILFIPRDLIHWEDIPSLNTQTKKVARALQYWGAVVTDKTDVGPKYFTELLDPTNDAQANTNAGQAAGQLDLMNQYLRVLRHSDASTMPGPKGSGTPWFQARTPVPAP